MIRNIILFLFWQKKIKRKERKKRKKAVYYIFNREVSAWRASIVASGNINAQPKYVMYGELLSTQ